LELRGREIEEWN